MSRSQLAEDEASFGQVMRTAPSCEGDKRGVEFLGVAFFVSVPFG